MPNMLKVGSNKRYQFFIRLFCIFVFSTCTSQTKVLKVISYNVLYGFNHNTTESKAVKWLLNEAPDVLVLQELKGYDLERLQALSQQWGHSYCYLWNRPGAAQPIAITSKAPVTNVETAKINEKDKGFLVAKTLGITFINVHLHPNNVNRRVEESKAVIKYYKQLSAQGEEVVVLGDFNAMSPLDSGYIDVNLNARLKQRIEKNKCSDLVNKCTTWDYSVLQQFYDADFVDVVYNHLTNKGSLINNKVFGTFPSMASKNINDPETRSQHLHRLDYVLMPKTNGFNILSARIVQNEITETISDHYPVVVTLSQIRP